MGKTIKQLPGHLIKWIAFPVSFLPPRAIDLLAKMVGGLSFYLLARFRKRILSNLMVAYGERLSQKRLMQLAKGVFYNLAVVCLEYPKLSRIDSFTGWVECQNQEMAQQLIARKQGVVFFCAHQANWELLFLEGTQRMPGVAIGRPIKNRHLYHFIVSIRERFGGKIVPKPRAMQAGIQALRAGKFFGIVGDQGSPESAYSFHFFGQKIDLFPVAALLAYRTNSPLIVATIKRVKRRYQITYSDPIWPNKDRPAQEEVTKLTQTTLSILERSVRQHPSQWFWVHNLWKRDTTEALYHRFRLDPILILLPDEGTIYAHLSTFRQIYPRSQLTVLLPQSRLTKLSPANRAFLHEVTHRCYDHIEELFLNDYRFKLVFNCLDSPSLHRQLTRHFLSLSVFEVIDRTLLQKLAKPFRQPTDSWDDLLKKGLTRPGRLWEQTAT